KATSKASSASRKTSRKSKRASSAASSSRATTTSRKATRSRSTRSRRWLGPSDGRARDEEGNGEGTRPAAAPPLASRRLRGARGRVLRRGSQREGRLHAGRDYQGSAGERGQRDLAHVRSRPTSILRAETG